MSCLKKRTHTRTRFYVRNPNIYHFYGNYQEIIFDIRIPVTKAVMMIRETCHVFYFVTIPDFFFFFLVLVRNDPIT